MKTSKVVFLSMLCIAFIVFSFVANKTATRISKDEENILNVYSGRIKTVVESKARLAEIMEQVVLNYGDNFTEDRFNSIASSMYSEKTKPIIAYLPDGIVTLVFPRESNKNALGVNVLENKHTKVDAQRSIKLNRTIISGPFKFLGEGFGFVVRNPIFRDGKFIGFSMVGISINNLLQHSGIVNLEDFNYEYTLISRYNGENVVAKETQNFDKKHALYKEFDINENTWTLGIYRQNKISQVITYSSFWFFAILFVGCVVSYMLLRFEQHREELNFQLERDKMTGALNRLGLEKYIEHTQNTPFALFFIDLNKFKPVNDTHGHEIGDKLLVAYVKRLKAKMKSDTKVVRIGGDEFVLIAPKVKTDHTALAIKKRICELSERVFYLDNIKIEISASIGYVFSHEADDIKELLEIADQRMYEEKGGPLGAIPR